MNPFSLFDQYEALAAGADRTFTRIQQEYGSEVRCKNHCSDCCHAVFGLFIIEAAYIKSHFDLLSRPDRRAALIRGEKAARELVKIGDRLKRENSVSSDGKDLLSTARIRCPLLGDNEECILYPNRPITCRVYGIPISIRGKPKVCAKSGFKAGMTYPTFDLDRVFQELYRLSKDFLLKEGRSDLEKASLLISVSKALATPVGELINGIAE